MAAVTIAKCGSKLKITIAGDTTTYYVDARSAYFRYKAGNVVDIRYQDGQTQAVINNQPIAQLTINAVVITNQATFDTNLAAVAP